MEVLFTPWRYSYITGNHSQESCFFCRAAEDPDDPERLVVFRGEECQVLLNLHPYTSGHLLVAPLAHLASPDEAEPRLGEEIWKLIWKSKNVLERIYGPAGFNIGFNLGRAAGAGVPGHFHCHVVPRWSGDTNFMGSVAGVRLIPEDPAQAWRRLRDHFDHGESE